MNTLPSTRDVGPNDEVQIGKTWVAPDAVMFFEAQGNYLRIVTDTIETLERFRISEAVSLLPPDEGLFIHRSRWVSFAGVTRLEQRPGQIWVTMRNGESFAVASTRQSSVLDSFAARGISA